jgi:WS/DGAT/MGAT family acyltransferase
MDGASEIARLARWAASSPAGLAMRPRESASELWRMARGLRGIVSDLTSPVVCDPLAASTSGLSRRLDVMAVSLERLCDIKAPLGITINDLILAVLAGALGTYHRERGVAVPALNCMVPMSLRGEDELSALGNRVGMFSIVLPVGEQQPRRRIELITKQTAAAKTDKRGSAAPFLVRALILLPGIAFRWLARQSLGRVNLCCTNIPGVRERRYMAGAEVEAIYPFASVVEGTPLVVALLSYAGSMDIGIDTDPEAIPDPHRIAELFTAGLDEMAAVASHTAYRREDRRRQLATQ